MITLRRALLASFLLALVIRLVDVIVAGPIRTPDTAGFAGAADAIRQSLLTNADIFRTRPPLYAVFLAVVPFDQAVVLIQAFLGAAIAPLVGLATARHFGRAAGATAGIAVALMPPFIEWTPYLLSDVLALTFLAIAIERLSAAQASGRARGSAVVGAGGALAVLTRPAYTAALAALAISSVVRRKARFAHLVLFVVGVVAIFAFPTIRNAAASGSIGLYEGRGWETLWEGTQWTEQGRGTGGIDFVVPAQLATMSDAERTDFFRRETIRAFTERPLQSLGLILKKCFWYLLPAYPEWSLVHKAVSVVSLAWLYLFAAWGAWRHRGVGFTWSLLLVGSSFVATAMLTVVDYDARYRLPFILSLVPLAGAGTAAMLALARRPQPLAFQS